MRSPKIWLPTATFVTFFRFECLKLLVLGVHIQSQKHNSVQYILRKMDTPILGHKIPYPADKHLGELPGACDIPAISMVMCMTGHNGFSPCRMCKILGMRIPASQNNMHYVPLDRSLHPTVTESNSAIAIYDAANLPLRTEEEMLHQAREVRNALSKTQRSHLSRAYGINVVSILSNLKSLCFLLSFPYDFMHQQ